MKFSNFCNKAIEYSFYAIFLLVPLVFMSDTSELFEFNKMWLTFGLTIIIGTAWFTKIVLQKRIFIQRTPLDIPILLFLLSQIISTFNSLDVHVSLWGYYSRFNGGLLSIISYIFLYYAFVSNFHLGSSKNENERADESKNVSATQMVKRLLYISLASGLIVSLWGIPAHFGYDPTCFVFRGTFDVSCWTEQFQPKVRIFSTLGQPNWMGAYLSILIPIIIAFTLSFSKTQMQNKNNFQFSIFNFQFSRKNLLSAIYYLLFTIFFAAFLFTRSRSSFLGLVAAGVAFFILVVWQETKSKAYKISIVLTGALFFTIWTLYSLKDNPLFSFGSILLLALFILQIGYFSYKSGVLKNSRTSIVISSIIGCLLLFFTQTIQFPNLTQVINFSKPVTSTNVQSASPEPKPSQSAGPVLESGGTESGRIRKIVWMGAIDIWKNNPIFGTGVETYAFAYYKYRPAEHNLVSEWDYLYNKAHNEYLNYLATTGAVGLGTYLLMIGWFLFIFLKQFKNTFLCHPELVSGSKEMPKQVRHDNKDFEFFTLNFALVAGYISILISNFLGFSIVIVNLYLFFIPAFVFILNKQLSLGKSIILGNKIFPQSEKNSKSSTSPYQWTVILIAALLSIYFLITLLRYWQADRAYALGFNLDRIGRPEQAYPKLQEAVSLRNNEPVFQDELSINGAVLAVKLVYQKDIQSAEKLAKEALDFSNNVITYHPNNVVFWKSRVRVFYTLSQVDPKYLQDAVNAIEKAHELAPTDAKVTYNLGLLYGQQGNVEKAVQSLERASALKPGYIDAQYALGLYYHEMAVDKQGKIKNPAFQKKAIETMQDILKNNPENKNVKDSLKNWGEP